MNNFEETAEKTDVPTLGGKPDYLKGLNEKQYEAVLNTEGPLLILAGAGAGKTKTVTQRILHLMEQGVTPESILAITFTNKAAKEMRERVQKLMTESRTLNLPMSKFSNNYPNPFVSTFHALSVYILKESGRAMDIGRHFSIYDKSDSKQAIKESLVAAGHDPKKIEPSKVMGVISREKGNYVSQAQYEAKNGNEYMGKIVADVWKRYENILKKEKALDFDDLLFKATELLDRHPDIRAMYQKRWKYVHVDEYQDTNKVQYTLMQLIVGGNKDKDGNDRTQNIAVVGDIDQNIYSWRGADIKNILRFEDDYPGAKVILLEENYRSTQIILSVANDVIKKNVHRREKNLFTKNAEGEKITLYVGFDESDEANFIGNTSRELIREGAAPESICVLYRANFQSRALEEAFLNKNIPYQILGTRFFERREVKDLLSYAHAALNPESLSDIKRIINVPVRGIGKVSLLKILEGREGDLPAAGQQKVAEFRAILSSIRNKIETVKPSEAIKYILTASGIEKMLREGKTEDEERLENAKELVTLASKYDIMVGGPSADVDSDQPMTSLEAFEKLLEEAALASDQDAMNDGKKNEHAVKLMTIHASKGLEFDTVFIGGLESDLFPHVRSNEDSLTAEEAEEERRLFYVALTRARKKIYLSYANVRTIFGNKKVNVPSEFLNDIDALYLEEQEPVTGIKSIFIDF